jgi:aspartyl/asparaginyl-tRNA synthetase
MEADADNPELSLSVDLLAPEGYGEIIGGGQRTAQPGAAGAAPGRAQAVTG